MDMSQDQNVTNTEQKDAQPADLEAFFDGLLAEQRRGEPGAERSLESGDDLIGVPLSVRRRLAVRKMNPEPVSAKTEVASGADDRVAVPDPDGMATLVETDAKTGNNETFTYHEGDDKTPDAVTKPEARDKDTAVREDTSERDKPSETLSDARLVDIVEIEPDGGERGEKNSAASPKDFESAEDGEKVLEEARSSKDGDTPNILGRLHMPHLPQKPMPVEVKANELRQGLTTSPAIKVEEVKSGAEDPESAHNAETPGVAPPVEPFLPNPEGVTAENKKPGEFEETASQAPEVLGNIRDGEIVETPETLEEVEPKLDPRITVNKALIEGNGDKQTDLTAIKAAKKPPVEKPQAQDQDTTEGTKLKKQGFLARLFGGDKHGAHDINSMKEPTTADVAGVVHPEKPDDEKLDQAA
jgi:hypothetical protein